MRSPAVIRLLALVCVLGGCAGSSRLPEPNGLATEPDLLSGSLWFDDSIVSSDLPEHDLLGLDEEMQAFVSDAVGRSRLCGECLLPRVEVRTRP